MAASRMKLPARLKVSQHKFHGGDGGHKRKQTNYASFCWNGGRFESHRLRFCNIPLSLFISVIALLFSRISFAFAPLVFHYSYDDFSSSSFLFFFFAHANYICSFIRLSFLRHLLNFVCIGRHLHILFCLFTSSLNRARIRQTFK